MKLITKNCLGFNVPVKVYDSLAEAVKAADGKESVVLEQLNNNLYYRGTAVQGRSLVADAVEAVTGVKRKTAPVMEEYEENGEKKTRQVVKDGEPVVEYVGLDGKSAYSEAKYVDFAVAQSNKTVEQLQPAITDAILKELADSTPEGQPKITALEVDIKTPERQAPKPKSLPAKLLEAAKTAISVGKVDALAKDYKKKLGKDSPEGKPLKDEKGAWIAENVGWALKEIIAENERLQTAQYGA